MTEPPTEPRRCLYVDETMLTEHGYIPSMITEGVAGHSPMIGNGAFAEPWYWGHDLAAAQKIAADSNARMGLSEEDVREIRRTSMAAQGWPA